MSGIDVTKAAGMSDDELREKFEKQQGHGSYAVHAGKETKYYTGAEMGAIKRAYQRRINTDDAYAQNAFKSYTQSGFDKYAYENNLPSLAMWNDMEKYAKGGGVSENYSNVTDEQWNKINELWKKDWEYGLTDEDVRRRSLGLAPVAYDDMYEDTLLDTELKQKGLPPSKLLNGKLGETYREWSSNAKKDAKFFDEATRKYISENDTENTAKRGASNVASVLSGGKASSGYSMEDALRDTMNDPKWMDYAHQHYGMSMAIPNPDDEDFLVKEDGVPKIGEDGEKVYDQEKYKKAWDNATKNNLGIDNDEFAITIDKLQQYYNENGTVTKADMAAQEWFENKGIKFDYDTRFENEDYVAKMNDLYAGELVNDGEGFTLDTLFPDAQFTEEDRKAYQPVVDELNRLRLEEGYDAAREYFLSDEFSTALRSVDNDRLVASLRKQNADVDGYDKKTDAEILHSYYDRIGKSYLMTDDEIAKLESGELTVDQYMASKCSTEEDAVAFANAQYEAYCKKNNLPITADEWKAAIESWDAASDYFIREVPDSEKPLLDTSENEWDQLLKDWTPIATKYATRADAYNDGGESAAEEWQYARDIVSEAKIAKQYWENIRSVDSYCDPSKSWDDQMRFSAMQRDDANIKKLAYRADAFAYTPEFAAKTADKSYVDQRFESIVNRRADEGIEATDLTPAVLAEIPVIGKLAATAYVVNAFFNGPDVKDLHEYATDEDKAKIVYMFDKTGRDETNRVISLEAETYLNKYMTHKWDAIRRADKAEQSNYFNSEGKTGFGRWVGATATVLNATASGLVEAPSNLLTDTATIILGKEMYSSNRLTTSSDRMSNLSQHLVDRDGNKIGAFAINLIPSMAQSGASMALAAATNGASEAFTLALMGTQSYSNAVDTALQNGASAEQAYVYGLMNGANEIIFEKLSLDKFVKDIDVVRAAVDAARKTGKYSSKQLTWILAKEMLRRANRQGFVEGSEEFFTSIANLLAENWILADKSARSKTIQHYVDAGMSEEDASALADKEIFNDVLVDFIGGYVSGFLMAAGGDLIKTSGGRFFVDRTGVTDFVTATHNLSLVSFDNALSYAKANLEVDSDGKISATSAQNVFNDLRKQGADAATLSRVMNEYSDNATPDAQTAMRTAITEQKAEDGKKLTKAARKYVYNRVAQGKSNVTKGQIEFATKEWLDHYSGAVQQGDIRELANNARMMREGYIEDIARLAGGSYVATGMTQMSEYYASLPVDVQQQITQNAEQYKATFNEAFADGNRAAQYANMTAIMEYAVGEGKALQGLNSIFGDGAAVAPQAVRNAILGTDSTTAQRYVERVAEGVALLNRQSGNHLFSAAQNGVDATAYVATQFALAQSMPTDSLSKSMYDYIAKYGATNEALDLLTAATIHESSSPFARQIRLTTGTFNTSEQLQQITNEYQKALTDYNEKLKIKQAHEQADTQERAEHEGRIANYTAQVEQLEKNVKEDASLAKTFGSRVAELQTAKSAFETLVAKQNQRMTQTNADVAQAESKYKAAKTKYWNAMQDQAAQYIQRFGSSLEAIKGRQRISHAELTRMSALAQYGTAENLNDINTKIIASEKASAVALGRALGVDVQCAEFGKAFFDEKKIEQSNRNETSPGVVIGGTVYLNTKVMEARVGSLTDQVLMHELGHVMESSADNYKKYAMFAKDFLIKRDGKGAYDYAKKAFMESGMTEQQAERELVAEFTRQVALADPRAVAALCKSAPKMSMRIFQWLTNTRNRMNSVATAQSKIIIDAQREFAKGMKAIRNNKVATQNVDNTSLSPTRDTMVNATKQLQERMRLESENQRNATQQTTEQHPAQPTQAQQQTDQKTEAKTETPTATVEQQSAEKASAETVEETPEETVAEEPVVAEAEQPSETVEETPAEAETPVAEETVEETPSEEPVAEEQTAEVVEEQQAEETSAKEEPVEDFADVVVEEDNGYLGYDVPTESVNIGIKGEVLADGEYYYDEQGNAYDENGNLVKPVQTDTRAQQTTEEQPMRTEHAQPAQTDATEETPLEQPQSAPAEQAAETRAEDTRPAAIMQAEISASVDGYDSTVYSHGNRLGDRIRRLVGMMRFSPNNNRNGYFGTYNNGTYAFGKSYKTGSGDGRSIRSHQAAVVNADDVKTGKTFVDNVLNHGYLDIESVVNGARQNTLNDELVLNAPKNTLGSDVVFTDEQKSQLKQVAKQVGRGGECAIILDDSERFEAESLAVLREIFANVRDGKMKNVSFATGLDSGEALYAGANLIVTADQNFNIDGWNAIRMSDLQTQSQAQGEPAQRQQTDESEQAAPVQEQAQEQPQTLQEEQTETEKPKKVITKEMKPLVDAFIEAERKKVGWQQSKVFKKTTAAKNAQNVLKSAAALAKKKSGISPVLANAYTDEGGRQIVTDSYRAYRFENAIDSLPKLPEGAGYPKIGDMLNRAAKSNTTEVPMPSLVILEELAKNNSNTDGKRLNYSFGENMPSVNAKFLYELCSTFPTAKLYIDSTKGAMSTLYAKSENGDGLLSPVRTDAKIDAETASNLKNALRKYASELKDPMPYITDESINEFVNNYAADAIAHGIQPKTTRGGSKAQYYTEYDPQYMPLAQKVKDGTATDADKAELRKQVDAAAKEAGYPVHVYRGGGSSHNVFDTKRGAGTTQYGSGTYFTDAKGLAQEWAAERAGEPDKGYVGEYYVGIKKMFDDTSTIEPTQEWKNVERILKGYGVDSARIKYAQNYGFEGIAKALQSVGMISRGAFDAYSWKNAEKVNKILRDAGYDGIKGEFYDSYQYVIFDPTQAKSADLVTYDNDGNIIPLSERFKTDRTGEDAWKNEDIRYYTEYDPQALAVKRSIDGLSEQENRMSGKPRMIQTSNGYMVARQVSREGLEAGNPMFNTERQNMAMIAPVSEFRGDVKRPVSVSQCTAVVVPNTDAYAETRADARNAGANVYAYDESDPSQFDRAIDRAANMSSVAYFPSMTYDELIAQYNAIPQGMKPRVENRRVPRQTTDRNRVSQTARTIAEAPITTDQGYSDLQSWIVNDNAGTFEPVSNTKSLNRARGVIERAGSLSQAAEDLHSAVANGDGKTTDLLARAELLYAEAQKTGNGLTALQREHIFADLCIIASDAGRALQLTTQLKRMTPEGHIDYIEQVGKRMADKYNKRTKKNVDPSLTEEEKEGYRRAVTDEQRKEIDKEVGKRWAEEMKDLPLLERIRNWRYFAMLGNPRTHFRNMVGNAMMNPVARAKDFNNTWLQRVFEHVGNEDTRLTEADRTTTYVTGRVDSTTKNFVDEQLKRMLPSMQSGSSKYMEEIAKASPVEDEDIEGPWLKRLAKVLTQPVNSARLSNSDKGLGGKLNKLSYINSNALELEDAKALGWRFRTAMYEIIKARGIDVTNITDEQLNAITNYAAEEALRATFRDASALADALNRFANTNRATRFAMEAIVPFKKTPINIAKRSFEYSPIGLVNGMYKLFSNNSQYKSEVSQIESDTKLTDAQKQRRIAEATAKAKQQKIVAIDRLASGVTGSLMTAIGFVAASMGWISIGRKDDDKASFEQALGKNAYSLNIGDLSIDLSAFSPAAVPMLMGTALYQSTSAEHDPNFVSSMVDVLAESIDPITEMSMISGIADALSGIGSQREDGANTRWAMQIAGNAVESYIGQFVPTFVGQAERALDPYTRSYTAGDEYWASKAFGSEIGSAVKGLQNKAGFGWLAEPKVNLHGEEQRNYTNLGSWVRNVLNNTILPATIKVDQKNEIDDELVRLYGVVDSADIFPSKPSRNLGSYNGEPIKLTNDKEYMEYQKEYGQTVYDLLEDLMMSREYQYMTDDQRASAVEKIIDQAKSATKKRWKAMKAQEQK